MLRRMMPLFRRRLAELEVLRVRDHREAIEDDRASISRRRSKAKKNKVDRP